MDAILFDCDGVLVDSEVIARRVVAEMFGRYVPDLDFDALTLAAPGMSDEELIGHVERLYNVSLPSDLLRRIEAGIDAALIAECEAIPGVVETVAPITLPTGVCSNSPLRRVQQSVLRAELDQTFADRLYCADMVAKPKPAPDVYLLAADQLDVSPSCCLVVEDSVTGLRAARAARMTVIGFVGASHVGPNHGAQLRAAGAVAIASSMADVREAILSWAPQAYTARVS